MESIFTVSYRIAYNSHKRLKCQQKKSKFLNSNKLIKKNSLAFFLCFFLLSLKQFLF